LRGDIVTSFVLGAAVVLAGVPAGAAEAETAADRADAIYAATGVRGGLVVHVGCGTGTLTAALGAGEGTLVVGLDTDAGRIYVSLKNRCLACFAGTGRGEQ
jgi:predicted RNA methylase